MKKLLLLTLAIVLAGCAVRTELDYHAICPQREARNIKVAVAKFKDSRSTKTLASVRDLQGGLLLRVKGQDDMGEWVTDCLKEELLRNGYTICPENEDYDFIVHGDVRKALFDNYSYYAEGLKVEISLSTQQEELFKRRYARNDHPGINLFNAKSKARRILKSSIQELFLDAVEDLSYRMTESERKSKKLKLLPEKEIHKNDSHQQHEQPYRAPLT